MKQSKYYSPRKIASAIGVSESSLKRWCDRGLLEFTRTAGGHRRIVLADAVSFFRQKNIRVTKPEILDLPKLESSIVQSNEEASRRLLDSLLKANEKDSIKLLVGLFLDGWALPRIFDEVVSKTFKAIGDLWETKVIEVYRERQACEICSNAIRELKSLLPDPPDSAPFAIGGSVQGDHYSLPTLIAGVMLQSLGFRSLNLGNNIPIESLCSAARNHKPNLFWISVSHLEDQSRLIHDLQTLRSSLPEQTLFLVGGRALNQEVRTSLPATIFCDNMQQLKLFADNMNQFASA